MGGDGGTFHIFCISPKVRLATPFLKLNPIKEKTVYINLHDGLLCRPYLPGYIRILRPLHDQIVIPPNFISLVPHACYVNVSLWVRSQSDLR